uniref:Uncharacterized protein n=1 Tax=Candidatus Kentrum sp. DK TaxID=2126562 RepID=A0A450TC10_9GAMM|nr:MAG: hypothetical protein BECKDK2373B_GA0170837_11369 [Candidatus Kentron sp. DK]
MRFLENLWGVAVPGTVTGFGCGLGRARSLSDLGVRREGKRDRDQNLCKFEANSELFNENLRGFWPISAFPQQNHPKSDRLLGFPGFLFLEEKSRIKKFFLCESLRTLRLCGCNLFFFNRRGAEYAEIRREEKKSKNEPQHTSAQRFGCGLGHAKQNSLCAP